MYDTDLLGLNEVLGPIIVIITIGSVLLTILGLLYAIRSWMAQSAAFQTRKDVAEIKRMLTEMSQPGPISPSSIPPRSKPTDAGPKLADNSTSD